MKRKNENIINNSLRASWRNTVICLRTGAVV